MRRAAASAFLDELGRHPYADGLADYPVLPEMLAEARDDGSATRGFHTETAQQLLQKGGGMGRGGGEGRREGAATQEAMTNGDDEAGDESSRGVLIRVLCRTPGQVEAALKVQWLEEVILDFLEVRRRGGGGDGLIVGWGGAGLG